LIYAENELGQPGFYRYDKVERTMQRYIEDLTPVYGPIDDIDKELMDSNEYRAKLNKAAIIIGILSGLCALFIVLFIRYFLMSKGYKKRKKRK
jgi:hypothetical protein